MSFHQGLHCLLKGLAIHLKCKLLTNLVICRKPYQNRTKNKKVKDVCVVDGVDQNVIQMQQSDFLALKGTATLMISMFYQKELYEPWVLIQVSSKSVEKWASYGHLKNSIWPTFSDHFEYLISFQNFFNCLIFSYHYYHIICVSADMQLYT